MCAQAAAALPVLINCQFDSGNIEVEDASDPSGKGVQLRVRKDVPTELEKRAHMQWFHFKVTGVSDGYALVCVVLAYSCVCLFLAFGLKLRVQ